MALLWYQHHKHFPDDDDDDDDVMMIIIKQHHCWKWFHLLWHVTIARGLSICMYVVRHTHAP